MSQRASKTKTAATTTTTTTATTTKVTASDDWDTDPDFVRDMDEMDQRWGGNKRTVGSINMEELIDDVRREHRNLRDKYGLSSGDFPRSDFVEKQLHRTESPTKITTSANNFNKLSTEEMKREVMRSETSSYVKERNGASILSETTKQVRGGGSPTSNYRTTSAAAAAATAESPRKSPIPPLAPKPDFEELASRLSRGRATPSESTPARRFEKDTFITTDPPQQFKESTVSKSTFREEKSSASSSSAQNSKTSSSNNLSPSAFSRSIQDRIDAFKKEFEDIEHKVARKSDISKVIKKTTNSSSSSNVDKKSANDAQHVSQSNERVNSPGNTRDPPSYRSPDSVRRPASAAPFHGDDAAYQQQQQTKPKANIKSLSERFETLGRESSDDFKRRMEARRREFFDRIKTQVRETRKGLDGFDIDDSEDDDNVTRKAGGMRQFVSKLNTSIGTPAYKLSEDSFPPRPKVYTRRETTQEEVVSHVVKEDDRVVHDETKRNVEKTSSCHGSSDEEAEPSSIKYLDRELRKHSPQQQQRTQSPIDEIKRKVPVVELEARSAGLMARTLYDYQAAEEDELCFEVDDLITNIEKVDQGWYKGTITKGVIKRVGLFPANYVKLLNDTSEY